MRISADLYLPHARKAEAAIPWMYLDSKGIVTVGIGHALETPDEAAMLPFFVLGSGADATPRQIVAAWHKIKAQEKNRKAKFYKPFTDLRLHDDFMAEDCRRHVADFLGDLARRIPNFDDFPATAQLALLDMAYNIGVRGLLSGFTKLMKAVAQRDWQACAARCHRAPPISEERNKQTADWFRAAAAAQSNSRPAGQIPQPATQPAADLEHAPGPSPALSPEPVPERHRAIEFKITADDALIESRREFARKTAELAPLAPQATTAPPAEEPKPLAKSRTMWLGGGLGLFGTLKAAADWAVDFFTESYNDAHGFYLEHQDAILWAWGKVSAIESIRGWHVWLAFGAIGIAVCLVRFHDRVKRGH